MKRKVLIAMPVVDGRNCIQMTHFLCHAERLSHDPDFPWEFYRLLLYGYRPVEYMRNTICRRFLESDCERLWMIDDDIVPPPGAMRLLDVEADIVAGAVMGYTSSHDESELAMRILSYTREGGHWQTIMPGRGVREIDGAGTGSLLINRRVLEDPAMHLIPDLAPEQRDEKWAPAIFQMPRTPWGDKITTADLNFCGRAKDLGYSIKVWQDQVWGQWETLNLTDVVAYGTGCAKRAIEAPALVGVE